MEERQGWERPGWYLPDNKIATVLPYDYDGYYDTPKNINYAYADILKTERTFNFPPHDDIVSSSLFKVKWKYMRKKYPEKNARIIEQQEY